MEKIHKDNKYSYLFKKLSIDCEKCCGLCCTALYFAKSEGFPADKTAGTPCKNLMADFRCGIHAKLLKCKLKGCAAFDCFGAGHMVTQKIYNNNNWMSSPKIASQMFDVFLIVYQLNQMLWYLAEASSIITAQELEKDIATLIIENECMSKLSPEELIALDVDKYRFKVNQILKKTGELVALSVNGKTDNKKTTDFMGKNFKKANLDGKDFSMSLLIAANLEECSLRGVNFLGADLRDTNIKNTDLIESIFLTQRQVNSAKGNNNTKLPPMLIHPAAWQRD